MSLAALATDLLANHYTNDNGCLLTEYDKVAGLKVKASSTNGTSGIGTYRGARVYWNYDHRAKRFNIE